MIADTNATHNGFVVTSAVLLATEVCSSEVIHAQKCAASNTPESMQSANGRQPKCIISRPARSHTKGVSTAAATVKRTAAMAREEAPSA